MLYGGVEAALKFSKDYGNIRDRDLGVDGLLHVFQPYVNWSVTSADELDQNYPKIDRLTFTTRPRSLDPMRYTAIDEFDSWNIIRLGGRHQLITHRDDQSYEWLYLDTYMDSYINDPEGTRDYSNLYNDVRWQPLPWLGIDLETQLPVFSGGSGFTELSTKVRFMPNENWEFSVGYRQLNNHPVLLDSNRIDLATYIRLSENWGVGSRHTFEMDDGTMEQQQYTLQRELGDWIAGVGVSHMDNRYQNEFGIIFSLTLKSFPSASLPLSFDP
jgi:LPS-assembly protein